MKVYPSDAKDWNAESSKADKSSPQDSQVPAAIPRAESLEEADILGRMVKFVVDLRDLLDFF
jgi:hypothetical protein